jgi:hypothetical protein
MTNPSGRDRKRVIKAAEKLPIEQIADFVRDLKDSADDLFLVHDSLLGWFICPWHRTGDISEMTIDDEAVHVACVEFMRTHGCLVFDSWASARAYTKTRTNRA